RSAPHRAPPSSPTRRSSDLTGARPGARPRRGGRCSVTADDVDVDLAAAADQRVHDGAQEHPLPEPARGLADDDLADVARAGVGQDRKSTRLNSSHVSISYAV